MRVWEDYSIRAPTRSLNHHWYHHQKGGGESPEDSYIQNESHKIIFRLRFSRRHPRNAHRPCENNKKMRHREADICIWKTLLRVDMHDSVGCGLWLASTFLISILKSQST